MTTFRYVRPRDLAEACEQLSADDSVALAGGTDLLVAIRHHETVPGVVVDLKSVDEIGERIAEVDGSGGVHIGGRVVMSQLIVSEVVNNHFPALARAASVVGSVQIRNRATLAGNLCNASPAADTAPALLAYSAKVVVAGPSGVKKVSLEDFFVGPGATILSRGEVVTAVELPVPATRAASAFARVTRRRGVDLASVSLACVVETSGNARFGFGAVGPTPLVASATVEDLSTDDGMERLLAVTSPISDVRAGADYRRAMLKVHARRALQQAVDELGDAS